MTTTECLSILFEQFGDDLKFFCSATDSEWGTTSYTFYIWVDSLLLEQIKTPEEKRERANDDTCVPFLNKDFIGISYDGSIDTAIRDLFHELHAKGKI